MGKVSSDHKDFVQKYVAGNPEELYFDPIKFHFVPHPIPLVGHKSESHIFKETSFSQFNIVYTKVVQLLMEIVASRNCSFNATVMMLNNNIDATDNLQSAYFQI